MKILGLSCLYHDSAAALCIGGSIAAAAQEERFSRTKGDAGFPAKSIDYCLKSAGLSSYELDAVAYYDNPVLTFDRWIHNNASLGEESYGMIGLTFEELFSSKLWIHKLTENHLGMFCKTGKLLVTKHHVAHAASAFYPSPFENAAILTADGVGEWATTTIGIGNGNRIELLRQMDFPHSLGLLYSSFTAFCGFKVNSGEYKLMGLAPYGKPVYSDVIKRELIEIKPDGSYRLNMDYFSFDKGPMMVNSRFSELFGGPARIQEAEITKREMDLAASIQQVTEEVMILLAKTARKLTDAENLVMAGGVALNCVANSKILRENIFRDIWIQPAAGDSGGALGAALYAHYGHFGAERTVTARDAQKGSFLGPDFGSVEIKSFLDSVGAKYTEFPDNAELYRKGADAIAGGKVVGFFNGRMEFGPRALGARSILGDPRNPDMQERLNVKIKFRESFRPFAPAVLAEKASEYFDIDKESPYMLFVADVKHERRHSFSIDDHNSSDGASLDMLPIVKIARSDIPAVTHVDFSARLQTVSKEDNPDFHSLITEFYKLTGCPVIINTSFNVRGEPIVCTPEDAYRCFMHTDMDVLILEDFLLLKEEQNASGGSNEDWRGTYELD